MSLSETDIIARYFTRHCDSPHLQLGIGDDAALLTVPPQHSLAISTDTLVQGTHFFDDIPPHALGYKSLAVNLSDLAAMGASAKFALLSLTLKKANESWLENFSSGFFQLAKHHNVNLIGGNITRGDLNITVSIYGFLPIGSAILRSGAQPGDHIYVTGTLGDAGFALDKLRFKQQLPESLLNRLYYPSPRLNAGAALRHHATAAIDISDGFCADLEKILHASRVGGKIYANHLPLSRDLQHHCDPTSALTYALTAGEDYELCFTIPPHKKSLIENLFQTLNIPCTRVGEIIAGMTLVIYDGNQKPLDVSHKGYEHFQ